MLSNPYIMVNYLGMFSFYTEIFVLLMLFMRKFPRRRYFVVRLIASVAAAVGFAFLPILHIGIIGVSFFIISSYVALTAWFMFDTKFLNCMFYLITAWSIQHIFTHILWVICSAVKMTTAVNIVVYYAIYLAVSAAAFFACSFKRQNYDADKDRLAVLLISGLVIVVTCLLHDFVSAYSDWTAWHSVFAVICCMLALFVQFGLSEKQKIARKTEEVEREKQVLEQLLYTQSRQQKLASETVEIINRKCHDLKHQIGTIRRMTSGESEKHLKEIERAVMVYGDIAKTGNDALDVTLTEKCLLCEEHKIKFTYIVDGDSLNALDPVDISTLFGNILDNAIECADGEEEDKRIIRMNVSEVFGYLKIHCENYCSRKVEFKENLPVTNKPDKNYHGFGVKSIRFIAQKYGGDLVMEQNDELFNVNILLPRKDKAAA